MILKYQRLSRDSDRDRLPYNIAVFVLLMLKDGTGSFKLCLKAVSDSS